MYAYRRMFTDPWDSFNGERLSPTLRTGPAPPTASAPSPTARLRLSVGRRRTNLQLA
jgi:hypothetical protein